MSIWVGTYNAKDGQGLYPLIGSPSGEWTVGDPFTGALNASFGTRADTHGLQYLVDEHNGLLAAYRPNDGWKKLAATPTGGSQPCFVTLSPDGTRLVVANYGDGSIALFPLDPETGLPIGPPQLHCNSGKGPHPDRQQGPHAHCVRFSPDGRWLYQVDLGTDEILAFAVDSDLGRPLPAFRAPSGSGPRHLIFHPSGHIAFLISELASSIDLLRPEGPAFRSLQRQSTLPQHHEGESLGGHIDGNSRGDRIYVTNRGHDSIATFAFDGERLSPLQHRSSSGSSPRHFLLLEEERLMVVAHEESGNVTGFLVDEDGMLGARIFDLPVPGAAYLFHTIAT